MKCYKLEIFVPEEALDAMKKCLKEADAGHIGNYDCALSYSQVMSTWRPLEGASPYIGDIGEIHEQSEYKIEVTVKADALEDTLNLIRQNHPYEEPVINVIELYMPQVDMVKKTNAAYGIEDLSGLFNHHSDTSLLSCIQGIMGEIVFGTNQKSVAAVIGDFCFLGGTKSVELYKRIINEYLDDSNPLFLVPTTDDWKAFYDHSSNRYEVEAKLGIDVSPVVRYAFKKDREVFNIPKLEGFVSELPKDYVVRSIDEEMYDRCLMSDWSKDFVSNYGSYEKFRESGLGFVIQNGKGDIVCGTSSYSSYDDGYEIEVATEKNYRKRGLATISSAKFILESMKRGKYPSWDAANLKSAGLAQKLGYQMEQEYTAYEANKEGHKL